MLAGARAAPAAGGAHSARLCASRPIQGACGPTRPSSMLGVLPEGSASRAGTRTRSAAMPAAAAAAAAAACCRCRLRRCLLSLRQLAY